MTETVKVKIGVVVGSNGELAVAFPNAIGFRWPSAFQLACEYGFVQTTGTARYIVNIEVPKPYESEPTEITATAEAVE